MEKNIADTARQLNEIIQEVQIVGREQGNIPKY